MTTPSILVVTGASGSGKTATVQALEARALSGVRCYYFDSVGVPSAEFRGSGGPEGWQAVTTREWIRRLGQILTGPRYTCSMARRDRHSYAALLR